VLLLALVIFAVFVCALAVHAAAVRLMFALARDNNLPFAGALSHVSARSGAPVVPSLVVGAMAGAILVANINLPNVIEMLCSVAIVWANLAYLLVTFPLLLSRRGNAAALGAAGGSRYFSLGRWGLPVNVVAVVWGLFVVTNIGWPRTEIYGSHPWGRFAAPLGTLALVGAGTAYYLLYQRKRTGIVLQHRAGESLDGSSLESKNPTIEARAQVRLVPGE
jgi:amino acid transporter